MDTIRFGRTELQVSKIALGGIPLMRTTKDEAIAIVREALASGINFIDTAQAYSDSEEKIGAAIHGIPREDLVLTTKSMATSPLDLSKHLDASLKKLGVEYVDIYQLHNVSTKARYDSVFEEGAGLDWLQKQIKAGKIRHAGFSSHSVDLALKLMETDAFSVVQLPFNYIDCQAERAIDLARTLDMGFIAMKPLGGGRLNNAGTCFRFLLQYDSIVPDPGIQSLEELREIVSLVESKAALTDADKGEIARLRAELGESWCHRCDYCQPCPQDINISAVLVVQSTFKRYSSSGAHGIVDKAITAARNCIECKLCTTRCPYHLEIPALLKKNIAYYDAMLAE